MKVEEKFALFRQMQVLTKPIDCVLIIKYLIL